MTWQHTTASATNVVITSTDQFPEAPDMGCTASSSPREPRGPERAALNLTFGGRNDRSSPSGDQVSTTFGHGSWGLIDFKGRERADTPCWLRANGDVFTKRGRNGSTPPAGDPASTTESAK